MIKYRLKISLLIRKILFIAVIVFGVSCTDQSIEDSPNESLSTKSNVGIGDVSQLIGSEQRDFYFSLSPEIQKNLWIEKIDSLISIENDPNYIVELENYRSFTQDFDFRNPEFTNDDLQFLDDFVDRSINDFDKTFEYIEVSFMSFEFVNKASRYNFELEDIAPPSNGKPDCNTRCGYYSDITCGPLYCGENCEETSVGCGFIWMQDCTGKCIP